MEAIQLNDFVHYTYYKHFKWAKKSKDLILLWQGNIRMKIKQWSPKLTVSKWDTVSFIWFLSHKEEN